MKKIVITLLFLSTTALSEVPHEFHAGEQARADEVNENFNYLDNRVNTLIENDTTCGTDPIEKYYGSEPGTEFKVEFRDTPYDSSYVKVTLDNLLGARFDISFAITNPDGHFILTLLNSTASQHKCTQFIINGYKQGTGEAIEYGAFLVPAVYTTTSFQTYTNIFAHDTTTTVRLYIHVLPDYVLYFQFMDRTKLSTDVPDFFDSDGPTDFTSGYNTPGVSLESVYSLVDDFVDTLKIEAYNYE